MSIFDSNTKFLLHNGISKTTKELTPADTLVGYDSAPHTILCIDKIKLEDDQKMYTIKELPYNDENSCVKRVKYTIGGKNLLTLRSTDDRITQLLEKFSDKFTSIDIFTIDDDNYLDRSDSDDISTDKFINISVEDYLKLPIFIKQNLFGTRNSIMYPLNTYKQYNSDVGVFAYWLANYVKTKDMKRPIMVSNCIHALLFEEDGCDDFERVIVDDNLSYVPQDTFFDKIKHYNLDTKISIPDNIKYGDTYVRTLFLACFLEGSSKIDILGKWCKESRIEVYNELFEDIVYITRSLGHDLVGLPCGITSAFSTFGISIYKSYHVKFLINKHSYEENKECYKYSDYFCNITRSSFKLNYSFKIKEVKLKKSYMLTISNSNGSIKKVLLDDLSVVSI